MHFTLNNANLFVICNTCKSELAWQGSTMVMMQHLKRKHVGVFNEKGEKKLISHIPENHSISGREVCKRWVHFYSPSSTSCMVRQTNSQQHVSTTPIDSSDVVAVSFNHLHLQVKLWSCCHVFGPVVVNAWWWRTWVRPIVVVLVLYVKHLIKFSC